MNDALSPAQPKPDRPRLTFQHDDFSVKLTMADDPKFWWRVEKTYDNTILITDFMPGSQDDRTMATALKDLIAQIGQAPPLTLIFHDLVPGSPEPGAYRIRLNDVAQSIERWSQLAADLMKISLVDTQLQSHQSKSRMIVTFK